LRAYGLDVEVLFKVNEGRPNIADAIVNRKVDLIVNTSRASRFSTTARCVRPR
jgi:carbamoyl-phosphate synthase large subunit